MKAERCRNSSLVDVSTTPKFFVSQPAEWSRGEGIGEPFVPTIEGKMVQVEVYEPKNNTSREGMFFPIHKACLDIIQRLCHIRQAQSQASRSEIPKTFEAFCEAYGSRDGETSLTQICQWVKTAMPIKAG